MAVSKSFSSSSQFFGTKFVNGDSYTQPISVSVNFRPVRVSATATAERATATTSYEFQTRRIGSSPASSLYEVLGIPIGATCQEIKTAYRRLARVLHPDVAADESDAGFEFMKLHEAYETLSDPEKRADYDRTLLYGRRRPFSVSSDFSGMGYSGRSWETDQCW